MSKDNPDLTYLVPCDTEALLRQEIIMSRCENLSLILGRYVPQEVIRNDSVGRFEKWRDRWLKTTCGRFRTDQSASWRELMEARFQRWDAMTSHAAHRFEGQLEGAMVVGLGGESVLETAISLHPISGLPYIPGSALKGITRAYALFSIAEQLGVPVLQGDALLDFLSAKKNKKDIKTPLDLLDDLLAMPHLPAVPKTTEKEQKAWEDKLKDFNDNKPYIEEKQTLSAEAIDANTDARLFRLAFGSQSRAGLCIFFDAVLSGLPRSQLFEVDVMTPHYPDYYSSEGKEAPSDDQGPNPIQFITVAEGTRFGFAFDIQPKQLSGEDTQALTEAVANWLQSGVSELGAGAKTHAGYGLFRILK